MRDIADGMLSFIIPAYNEQDELPEALQSVRVAAEFSRETFEIIVVDDASTDATAAVAAAAGARVIPVSYRQIAAVRNAGARAAQGDILFFVDADTHIGPQHVTGALAALQEGCAGGGAWMAIRGDVPMWSRAFAWVFSALYFGANLGAGAFLFTTRTNFAASGGFDERYYAGEEVFFTKALKELGRFELLRDPTFTSGRKLRMHSAREILLGTVALILGGRRILQSREKLEFWYSGKRERPAT